MKELIEQLEELKNRDPEHEVVLVSGMKRKKPCAFTLEDLYTKKDVVYIAVNSVEELIK